MPRGRSTRLDVAMTVKVVAKIGFEAALVSQLTGVPRKTVTDIIQGRKGWANLEQNDLYIEVEREVRAVIINNAGDLARRALDRLHEKLPKASFVESLNAFFVTYGLINKD